ncbi:hypothetical protein [uncultured Rhodoblastus sp.]|uniref:hypothetical protein n=1 Tax=uncultured Rhodoblastus sp. TaxID=543037 RepID=UPI0025D5FE7F|nr:hypothetical protein [uncultured Rhodoblastus sp.]
MTSKNWRWLVAAAAALILADAVAAAPISANLTRSEFSPTLPLVVVRGGHGGHVARGGHVGGPRGGYHGARPGGYRGARPGAYRGGYRGGHNTVVVGGRGAWGRGYRWAPGGAIAAGAAIGFVAAAGAAAYATTRPPAPGLCWYYTDASRRSGFWDTCP